jgi:hypothetical protein
MSILRAPAMPDSLMAKSGGVVANVVLNVLTNYFNHVAQTEIDFPKVELAA